MFPTISNITGLLLNWLEELLTDVIESVGAMNVEDEVDEVDEMTEAAAEAAIEIGNVDSYFENISLTLQLIKKEKEYGGH